jgi:cytochrome c
MVQGELFSVGTGWFAYRGTTQESKMRRSTAVVAIGALMASLGGTVRMPLSPSCLSQKLLSQARADDAPQQVFNNACRMCHTIKEGDNRLGPNLFKIIGRKAGSLPQYNYSDAMKDASFVWDEARLSRFIANPDEVVPGNNMKPYGGLRSADDTKKVVAFLLSISAR